MMSAFEEENEEEEKKDQVEIKLIHYTYEELLEE